MTIRKRPRDVEDVEPTAKRANLADSDKNGLKAFLAISFTGLKGYEEAARERFDFYQYNFVCVFDSSFGRWYFSDVR
jgi:hypothetical protein